MCQGLLEHAERHSGVNGNSDLLQFGGEMRWLYIHGIKSVGAAVQMKTAS